MYFKFEFEGIVHVAPTLLASPSGGITHGMVVVVQTGQRGGSPHHEYIYVALPASEAEILETVGDGTHIVWITAKAFWTYTNESLSGEFVPAIAIVAKGVKIVRERKF